MRLQSAAGHGDRRRAAQTGDARERPGQRVALERRQEVRVVQRRARPRATDGASAESRGIGLPEGEESDVVVGDRPAAAACPGRRTAGPAGHSDGWSGNRSACWSSGRPGRPEPAAAARPRRDVRHPVDLAASQAQRSCSSALRFGGKRVVRRWRSSYSVGRPGSISGRSAPSALETVALVGESRQVRGAADGRRHERVAERGMASCSSDIGFPVWVEAAQSATQKVNKRFPGRLVDSARRPCHHRVGSETTSGGPRPCRSTTKRRTGSPISP